MSRSHPSSLRRKQLSTSSDIRGRLDGSVFPAGSLLVTRGTVEDSDETMSYQISTCPGMGGSCVLYQGSVIGKNSCAYSANFSRSHRPIRTKYPTPNNGGVVQGRGSLSFSSQIWSGGFRNIIKPSELGRGILAGIGA